MDKTVILCSASPRRQELLKLLVPAFEIVKSEADETCSCSDAGAFSEELSRRKAKAVWERLTAQRQKEVILISADTSVWLDGEEFGKPADRQDAFSMISRLAGHTHTVVTGVTVLDDEREVSFSEKTQVSVLPMQEEEIESYVNSREPYDKAGGYGIQGRFCRYISGIRGDYFTVVGLPVSHLWQVLKTFGFR
jgi:septum formation protein